MALKTNSNSFEYKDSQWGEPSIGRIPLIISQFYHGKMFSLLWEKPNFCFCFLAFSQEKGVPLDHCFSFIPKIPRQEASKMSSPPTSEDRVPGLNLMEPLVELSREGRPRLPAAPRVVFIKHLNYEEKFPWGIQLHRRVRLDLRNSTKTEHP